MGFQLVGLSRELYDKTITSEKLPPGARWITVDSSPGYPCRVSLADAKVGERVLALEFCHHAVNTEYRASGPIFVRENCVSAKPAVDEIPMMFAHRQLSLRGYDHDGFMIAAEVVHGLQLRSAIEATFENRSVAYLHIHNAAPGCFNCAVVRA